MEAVRADEQRARSGHPHSACILRHLRGQFPRVADAALLASIAPCLSNEFSGDVQPRKAKSMRRIFGYHRYVAQRCCSTAYREDAPGGDIRGARPRTPR
ncbi:hypothetical protein Mpe_B0531 (plasmid) [Methylibium petroleiphilum PM1]|uniref:Uncharacterized protein n=1 Tax=Methylibium petroleiphilum (strain ATCC BAA-1232 / LMG 22953 / PM1) TaxID=420662 RepID=A2SP12_METPP|nr:hypothetical protein Mpe_B0531 [Methylibium petroleiphilum PM1]